MRGAAQWLTMAVVAALALRNSEAQLLHNIKNFVSNIPTFNSPNNPTFDVQNGRVNVDVPVPDNVKFGTVDQNTGTWQLTDKSLGAGVAVGPQGAQLLTVTPSAGSTQVTQAAALGPNGLTIGPNKVDTETSQAERQAQGNLGIQNLRIGKDGLIINDGSRLNSSVQVDPQGIQLNGNPTGGGESHLYIKPNINLLGQQFGQAAPPKEPNNVQVSYGDGKSTATQQLQGYTNYQLDRSKGTVAQVPNQAPPFMGVNPNGQYRSYAGQASAPANMAASQAGTSQQQGAAQSSAGNSGHAAQAPVTRMQVVQTPTPRRFEYAGDLASGSPQAAAAYARQVGGSVQQAQQTMDQRQDVFDELQAKLNAQNAGRQPLAVAAPPPAIQSRDFQRLAGMSDAGSVGHVTSFVQQSTVPDQAPMPYSGNAPAPMTAQSMGRAPGPGYSFEGEDPSLDLASFLKKEKKHHSPSPGHLGQKTGTASTVLPHHKKNETSLAPEHHHKKNGTSPEPHHHKKNATSMGAAVVGKAHTLDSETSTGAAPAEVTSAAKQEAVNAGSNKSLSAVPAPLYAGGPPPSMMTSPVPQFSGPSSPTDTAAYVHGLLADKSAEVVGDTSSNGLHSWLAVSPASDTDESDSAGMPAPAQAPSQEAAPAAAPAQDFASAAAPAQFKAHPFASIVPMHNLVPEASLMAQTSVPAQGPDASPAEMHPLSAIVPMHVLVPATPYAAEGPAAAHAPSAAQGPAASRQQDLHKAKAIAMSAYRESLAAERAAGPASAPAPAGGPAAAQHQVTLAAKAIAMAAYEAEALASDMGPSPARAPAPASTGLGGRRLLGQ